MLTHKGGINTMNMDFFDLAIGCFLFLLDILMQTEWKKEAFTKRKVFIIVIVIVLIFALLVGARFT